MHCMQQRNVQAVSRALFKSELKIRGMRSLRNHCHRKVFARSQHVLGFVWRCSKDGLVKMWDVKGGEAAATLHGHKAPVTAVSWNANGNWLLTASRDQTCKVGAPYHTRFHWLGPAQSDLRHARIRSHHREIILSCLI